MTSGSLAGSRYLFWPPFLAGTLLRAWGMTRQPLWVDEILTLRAASIGDPFRWSDVFANPQGPLPHVLLRSWVAMFGAGDPALRAWSVLAGVAALAVGLLVFRRFWPSAAPLAGWFLALSPFQIWYAQEVRNYVFVLGAAFLVLATFRSLIEKPSARNAALHAAAVAGLLLCNLSGLLLIPALGLLAATSGRRRTAAAWTAATAVAVAAAFPWVWSELFGHVEWSGVTGIESGAQPIRGGRTFVPVLLPYTFVVLLGGTGLGPSPRLLHAGLSPDWTILAPGLIVGFLGVLLAAAGLRGRFREPRVRILLVWCTVPVLLAALVAAVGLKAYNARYVAFVQPAFLLLAAGGVAALARERRLLGRLGGVFLIAAMIQGYVRQTYDPEYGKEDFRAAAGYLEERARPGDLILQQGVHGPLHRYYAGEVPIETYYPVYFGEADGGEERLRTLIAGRERVWWVGSRLWYEDPDRRVLRWLAGRGEFVVSWDAPGVAVRAYAVDGEGE